MSDDNKLMTFYLKIWQQKGPSDKGEMVNYKLEQISPDVSFLEMLDILNERLVSKGIETIEFDNDCREGICGMCSLVINGIPHGPEGLTTTCQLHMRKFKDGDVIVIEPFRAGTFSVIKDLVVDRSSLDEIVQSGGYISVNTGGAPEASHVLVTKDQADLSMDAASCIGCGACVAACKNASAMLFTGAKISHLGYLPQGSVERERRALQMVHKMDSLGFGNCSNEAECEAVCPKGINLSNIARLNRDYLKALIKGVKED